MDMPTRQAPPPFDVGADVYLLDLLEQGRPQRTGAYLIRDERTVLIETGSAACHDALLSGLAQLGLSPMDLDYVVVTHVHLDHAGGAGQLLAAAENARLVVHPRGARHMADPSRLWEGARSVYQDSLEALFGSVRPVPVERILVRDHLETLDIGRRTLTFFDSPGHAKHHFTILDPLADALYAGDALGIRYTMAFTGWDCEFVLPTTSPVDFDPLAMTRTAHILQSLPFSQVFHTHFGPSPKAQTCAAIAHYAPRMAAWMADPCQTVAAAPDLSGALLSWTLEQLRAAGCHPGADVEPLELDMALNALGLRTHWQRSRPS